MSFTMSHTDRYATALDQAFRRIRSTVPAMGRDRPRVGKSDLTYVRCNESTWVDGFWSGQLWLAYDETKDPFFLKAAREQRPYFVRRLARPDSLDHDLGFLYSLSVVADYKLTGDEEAMRLGLEAAEVLAARFNPKGRFIRAWNPWNRRDHSEERSNAGRMIIDTLENLALLYWATSVTGDARFADVATAHADTSLEYLVRDDGSTFHLYDFDPDTGRPIKGGTHQGYADDSCWARGQGWGIHGYALIHAYTGAERFHDAARKIADFALPRLPEDRVPLWDFDVPEEGPRYRDSSAGAIMASGLFLLADRLPEGTADAYRDAADEILTSLVRKYAVPPDTRAEGLLLHGASNVPGGLNDTMLPYGDYFYLEALQRARGKSRFFW